MIIAREKFFYREKIINNIISNIKYNIWGCHPDQDYLQRPRVQYNNINNHLLGGRVQLPSLLFASLAREIYVLNMYEFNLDWRNSR